VTTAATRNLYLNSDDKTHAPSETDPNAPKCGTAPKPGAAFRPTLQRVDCQKCGPSQRRLDEFVSWDSEHVVGTVEDNGDSVSVKLAVERIPGVDTTLDMRIRPEDLDRFIARLTEIKEARGL
jgi:hypothetical protein